MYVFKENSCQNDDFACQYWSEQPQQEKKPLLKIKVCVWETLCVCTLRCTRVRSPKVLCTRVLTAASFVSWATAAVGAKHYYTLLLLQPRRRRRGWPGSSGLGTTSENESVAEAVFESLIELSRTTFLW